nr:MAG TPA: hypothetical protein [Caudoviricetes sp.]
MINRLGKNQSKFKYVPKMLEQSNLDPYAKLAYGSNAVSI